ETFKAVPGLSDHTKGSIAPVTSIPLGAKIIEKHLILDRDQGGPDASFSLEPKEFEEMVSSVRGAEKAMGSVNYELSEQQKKSREITGRSLFVTKKVEKGERFSGENLRSVRPGGGLHPKFFEEIKGKKANRDIEEGTPLRWKFIEV
ncbi:MAG: N-acetylneuraminate synthase family protein, partial [Flavobacteriales bacterium]